MKAQTRRTNEKTKPIHTKIIFEKRKERLLVKGNSILIGVGRISRRGNKHELRNQHFSIG